MGVKIGVRLCLLCLLVGAMGVLSVAMAAEVRDYLPQVLVQNQVERWHDQTRQLNIYITPYEAAPQFVPCVKEAFAQWEHALDGRLQFQYTEDPDQADIRVYWTNHIPKQSNAHTIIGKSRDSVTGTTVIYKIDSLIRTHSPYTGQLYSNQEVYNTALHEVGHMLGLHGHSPDPNDVMYEQPSADKPVSLSQRDIETIRRLYRQQAQITNPPQMPLAQFRGFMNQFTEGLHEFENQHYERAYNHLLHAEQLYPEHTVNRFFLGMSAFFLTHDDTSIHYLSDVLDQPESALPPFNRMMAQFALGESYYRRGVSRCQQQDIPLANLDLNQARRLLSQSTANADLPSIYKSSASAMMARLDSAANQSTETNRYTIYCQALSTAPATATP